ncbi:hypothetical protein K502DRAFT_365684 [Neoconidiobolus thromboides FSU 785]|nr:hypothetical protein K502DRAFT_365684 [Neoconidiobolus thromboides FSU 785]
MMNRYNSFSTVNNQRDGLVDPKAHCSNWFGGSNIEPPKTQLEPPPLDFPISLFDPSEQQFLSGFFDNLVEEKNDLFPNLDLSNLLNSWTQNQVYPDTLNKPTGANYSFNPISTPYHESTATFSPYHQRNRQMNNHVGSQSNYFSNNNKNSPYFEQHSSSTNNDISHPVYPTNSSSVTPVLMQNEVNKQTILPQSTKASKNSRSNNKALPPLKDEMRRANHIASEQKRRDLIRKCFSELEELVLKCGGGSCSKAVLLKRAADYIEGLKEEVIELQKIKDLKLSQLASKQN